MSRVFLDLNVVVDAVDLRGRFSDAAMHLCHASEARIIEGYMSAHALTTLSYLVARSRGVVDARRAVRDALMMLEVVPVDRRLLTRALTIDAPDYEDAVSVAAAEAAGCDFLVTRDPAGFRGTSIAVVDPATAVEVLLGAPPGQVSERKGRYAVARKPASRRTRR